MFDQQENMTETNAVARVVNLFPCADALVVSALTAHVDALQRYLAQAHQLTRNEVAEVLDAFVLNTSSGSDLSAAS